MKTSTPTLVGMMTSFVLVWLVLFLQWEPIQSQLTEAPATIYEQDSSSSSSLQSMDYDGVAKRFLAHVGWYQNKEIHYYKFRVYSTETYPDVITLTGSYRQVPVQRVFLVTNTGGWDGIVGDPIIEYHTNDGTLYSDFMEVHFVTPEEQLVDNPFQSYDDIVSSTADIHPTGIVINLPVVPTGSTLQDYETPTETAPIQPLMVWYQGVKVQTFLFEVTDEDAATYFADTRTTTRAAYAIPVTEFTSSQPAGGEATQPTVVAVPTYYMNQYAQGIGIDTTTTTTTTSMSNGPNPSGMRNILSFIAGDRAYSPLWQVYWATQLPINYNADEISSSEDLTQDQSPGGFRFAATPLYINCPTIGVESNEQNPKRRSNDDDFQYYIDTTNDDVDSYWIMGSSEQLIMKPNVPISFVNADDLEQVLATTQTNAMGAYEYELLKRDIVDTTVQHVDVIIDEETKDQRLRQIAIGEENLIDIDNPEEIPETTTTETFSNAYLTTTTPWAVATATTVGSLVFAMLL